MTEPSLPKEMTTLHCPKCGSDNIGYALEYPFRCCLPSNGPCGEWFKEEEAITIKWTQKKDVRDIIEKYFDEVPDSEFRTTSGHQHLYNILSRLGV